MGFTEQICIKCGKRFLYKTDCHKNAPKTCSLCWKSKQKQLEQEQAELENQAWEKKKEAEHKKYLSQLSSWNVISRDQIQPKAEEILYVLGNGFDLMHRVPSSYYSFRDSLGKNSPLRLALENFWTPGELWADFEAALAQFNAQAMNGSFIVDSWLEDYDSCNEDSGLAEFYLAIEGAANPIMTVTRELPRRFRMWVESLKIGTADRPLQAMFQNGNVLCFNYTEFVEKLYGVSHENVCYIHGCRQQKREKLILGHLPGASDESFNYQDKGKDPYQQGLILAAQDHVTQMISDCDEDLTKHSAQIIANHKDFFDSLSHIRQIVVIGHSLSQVDWEYFQAVYNGLSDPQNVQWYFGCHGLRDLKNIDQLVTALKIPRDAVSLFRTDDISTEPLPSSSVESLSPQNAKKRYLLTSPSQQWTISLEESTMSIWDTHGKLAYELPLPYPTTSAFFTPTEEYLFVIIYGLYAGVLLFHQKENTWHFVNELPGSPNQSLINPRLRNVFLDGNIITFVYNNRIRVFDLESGMLLQNQQVQHAKDRNCDGIDISLYFLN